jgi:uncharacterized metal-binding protein YceD (DUF177 family)
MIRIQDTPEWSKVIDLPTAVIKTPHITLLPSEEERKAVAKRLKLVNILSLSISCAIQKEPHDEHRYRLSGIIEALVTYECVVSLENFDEALKEKFDLRIRHRPASMDSESDDDEENEAFDVEYTETGDIDLGEIATEYLSLTLKDHPKKPGVAFDSKEPLAPHTHRPFEGLKILRS